MIIFNNKLVNLNLISNDALKNFILRNFQKKYIITKFRAIKKIGNDVISVIFKNTFGEKYANLFRDKKLKPIVSDGFSSVRFFLKNEITQEEDKTKVCTITAAVDDEKDCGVIIWDSSNEQNHYFFNKEHYIYKNNKFNRVDYKTYDKFLTENLSLEDKFFEEQTLKNGLFVYIDDNGHLRVCNNDDKSFIINQTNDYNKKIELLNKNIPLYEMELSSNEIDIIIKNLAKETVDNSMGQNVSEKPDSFINPEDILPNDEENTQTMSFENGRKVTISRLDDGTFKVTYGKVDKESNESENFKTREEVAHFINVTMRMSDFKFIPINKKENEDITVDDLKTLNKNNILFNFEDNGVRRMALKVGKFNGKYVIKTSETGADGHQYDNDISRNREIYKSVKKDFNIDVTDIKTPEEAVQVLNLVRDEFRTTNNDDIKYIIDSNPDSTFKFFYQIDDDLTRKDIKDKDLETGNGVFYCFAQKSFIYHPASKDNKYEIERVNPKGIFILNVKLKEFNDGKGNISKEYETTPYTTSDDDRRLTPLGKVTPEYFKNADDLLSELNKTKNKMFVKYYDKEQGRMVRKKLKDFQQALNNKQISFNPSEPPSRAI